MVASSLSDRGLLISVWPAGLLPVGQTARVSWIRRGPIGASVSDIFREIDEELRRDNLLKLWSRYGRYIVALAVLVLLVAGGIVAWRDHQLSERRAQSMRYSSALSLVREGKDADAGKVFALIAQEGGGYGTLAVVRGGRAAGEIG